MLSRRRPRTLATPPKPIPGLYTAPYLDSAVFIAWVMGEVEPDGTDRADVAEHILLLAERGHYKVYISSLTLAEVYKPKGYDPLNPTQNQRLLDYFENEFFEMVLVDRDIGLEANRIAAMHGLNPNDAIHTACALRAGCDVLLTWDTRFLNKTVPGIRIERPEKRGQLLLDLDEGAAAAQAAGARQTAELPEPAPQAEQRPSGGGAGETDGLGDKDNGEEAEGPSEETDTGRQAPQDGPSVRGSGQAPPERPSAE